MIADGVDEFLDSTHDLDSTVFVCDPFVNDPFTALYQADCRCGVGVCFGVGGG